MKLFRDEINDIAKREKIPSSHLISESGVFVNQLHLML